MPGSLTIALLNPLICAALAVTVYVVGRSFPKSRHLNFLVAALALTGIAFTGNDLLSAWDGPAMRIAVNIAFYLSITAASFAALNRVHVPLPIAQTLILATVTSVGFCWYLFVSPSVDGRIYVVNGAYSIIAGTTIWKLFKANPKSRTDRVFIGFAILLLCVSILRPIANAMGALTREDGSSDYWITVVGVTPLITVYCALVFMWSLGKQIYEELRDEAERDFLTALLNRRGFDRSVTRIRRRTHKHSSALIIGDIDDFKVINDTFGHTKGDEILRLVGETLSLLSKNALVARTGGEEFSIYFPNASREEIEQFIADITSTLNANKSRLLPDDRPLTLSFGACVGKEMAITEMTLVADAALYTSKAKGKNQLNFG